MEIVGDIKKVFHSDYDIFRVLSDFKHIELLKNKIPQDKIKNIKFDTDSCSFQIDVIGDIGFNIEERQPNKLIKLTSFGSPVKINAVIDICKETEKESTVKLTVNVELGILGSAFKSIIYDKLKDAVDKVSNIIEIIPYSNI